MNTILISESLQEIGIVKRLLRDKDCDPRSNSQWRVGNVFDPMDTPHSPMIRNIDGGEAFLGRDDNFNGDNAPEGLEGRNNGFNGYNGRNTPQNHPQGREDLGDQENEEITSMSRIKIYIYRVFILATCFTISLGLEDITTILSFSGSVFSPILSFFCPVILKI